MVRRRLFVHLALAAAATAHPLQGSAMNVTLYRNEFDSDLLPDLRLAPRQRGMLHRVLRGGEEPRLPEAAAAARTLLVVVFRLAADAGGSTDWSLAFEEPDAEGRPQPRRVLLRNSPEDGNVGEHPTPPANLVPPPGLMYRGAFWVDLDPLLRMHRLPPGSTLQLRYGLGEPVAVQLPN